MWWLWSSMRLVLIDVVCWSLVVSLPSSHAVSLIGDIFPVVSTGIVLHMLCPLKTKPQRQNSFFLYKIEKRLKLAGKACTLAKQFSVENTLYLNLILRYLEPDLQKHGGIVKPVYWSFLNLLKCCTTVLIRTVWLCFLSICRRIWCI